MNDYLDWPSVGQVGVIERQRIDMKTGLVQQDSHGFITSLTAAQANPEQLLALARQHWTIENKSHYVRDVVFHEDASHVRKGSLPQVMALLRNVTLNAMRRLGKTQTRTTFTQNCAQPDAIFAYLFF